MAGKLFVTFVFVGVLFTQPSLGQSNTKNQSLIVNGDFAQWNGNAPVGWTVEPGILNGAQVPLSRVDKIEGPAIELSGDSKTMAWNIVSQRIDLKSGEMYRLTFCLLYTSPSPRDQRGSRMPSSA